MNYSQFMTPNWQSLIAISRDVDASGQFKQDFGVLGAQRLNGVRTEPDW